MPKPCPQESTPSCFLPALGKIIPVHADESKDEIIFPYKIRKKGGGNL